MLPRVLTIAVPEGANLEPQAVQSKLAAEMLGEWTWIEPGRAGEWVLTSDEDSLTIAQYVDQNLAGVPVDFAVQTDLLRRKKLLVSDMDSTLIGQECIDELADIAGIGAKVAEITERAMRGELEFEAALRERVALLKGLSVDALEKVWRERVKLTPGADWLMGTMHHRGALRVLVSGGFEFFTAKVAEALGMDEHFANHLAVENGRLTGEVTPPILGKQAKLQVLMAQVQALGISPQETLAIGDGANDLPMLQAGGLGVAYHAKPMVESQTLARIRVGDLTSILLFMGIPKSEWIQRDDLI